MRIYDNSLIWQKPKEYICDEFKSTVERYIDALPVKLRQTAYLVSIVAVACFFAFPFAYSIAVCGVVKVLATFVITTAVFMALTELVRGARYRDFYRQSGTHLKALAAKVVLGAYFASYVALPLMTFQMAYTIPTLLLFCIIPYLKHYKNPTPFLYLKLKAADTLDKISRAIDLSAKKIYLGEVEIDVKNSAYRPGLLGKASSFAKRLAQFIPFKKPTVIEKFSFGNAFFDHDVSKHFFQYLDAKDFALLSQTSRQMAVNLRKPTNGPFIEAFPRQIIRQRWITKSRDLLESDPNLKGQKINPILLLTAKNTFDVSFVIRYLWLSFYEDQAVKNRAAIFLKAFVNGNLQKSLSFIDSFKLEDLIATKADFEGNLGINAHYASTSTDPNYYVEMYTKIKEMFLLILFDYYSLKDSRKSWEIFGKLITPESKALAILKKKTDEWLLGESKGLVAMMEQHIGRGQIHSEQLDRGSRILDKAKEFVKLFHESPSLLNKTAAVINDPLDKEAFGLFAMHQVYHPAPNDLASLHHLQPELKNGVFYALAMVQSRTNVYQAVETLSLLPLAYQIRAVLDMTMLMDYSPQRDAMLNETIATFHLKWWLDLPFGGDRQFLEESGFLEKL